MKNEAQIIICNIITGGCVNGSAGVSNDSWCSWIQLIDNLDGFFYQFSSMFYIMVLILAEV